VGPVHLFSLQFSDDRIVGSVEFGVLGFGTFRLSYQIWCHQGILQKLKLLFTIKLQNDGCTSNCLLILDGLVSARTSNGGFRPYFKTLKNPNATDPTF
jgi:hypothetical protein